MRFFKSILAISTCVAIVRAAPVDAPATEASPIVAGPTAPTSPAIGAVDPATITELANLLASSASPVLEFWDWISKVQEQDKVDGEPSYEIMEFRYKTLVKWQSDMEAGKRHPLGPVNRFDLLSKPWHPPEAESLSKRKEPTTATVTSLSPAAASFFKKGFKAIADVASPPLPTNETTAGPQVATESSMSAVEVKNNYRKLKQNNIDWAEEVISRVTTWIEKMEGTLPPPEMVDRPPVEDTGRPTATSASMPIMTGFLHRVTPEELTQQDEAAREREEWFTCETWSHFHEWKLRMARQGRVDPYYHRFDYE